MSTLFVANIGFESTDSNQIQYRDQTVTITSGGSNNIVANSSYITAKFFNTSITFSGTDALNYSNVSSISNVSVTNLTTNGQINYSGNVTPTLLTASTADWNPLLGNSSIIRVSSNAAITLYGMVEGTNGQIVVLNNIGNNAITLNNEDSVNESTASRRFNLPKNIILYSKSSISLIYDGVLSRWKAQNSLDSNYDYKSLLTKGFFSGGFTPTVSPTITTLACRTTYSTEATAAVPGANLTLGRDCFAAAGNSCKGFFSGGSVIAAPGVTTVTDRTTYATEATAAVPGANLTQAKFVHSSSGNACKGFFSGGNNGCATILTSDRTTYATETTAAVPGANLSQARNSASISSVGNACKGFFAGGDASCVRQTTACRTTYSTETIAAVSGANLSQARSLLTAAGNACKGFFSGGATPIAVATADRTIYSTETTSAVPGANLSQARSWVAAAGNSCKGFFSGGGTGCTTVATADRTTYFTEVTAAVPGANLTRTVYGHAAV